MTLTIAKCIETGRAILKGSLAARFFNDAGGKSVGGVALVYKDSNGVADDTFNTRMTALVASARRPAGSRGAGYTPAARHEDEPRSECAMLLRACKRLRTCRELWPDNELAWCEYCCAPQKDMAGS